MAVWTDSEQARIASQNAEPPADIGLSADSNRIPPGSRAAPEPNSEAASSGLAVPPLVPRWDHGWPVPSSLSANSVEARACIQLPEFDALLLEKARVISGRFPFAEAEYRNLRAKEPSEEAEIPHFEKVFRIAATIASIPHVQQDADYDTLLILTAWHS